MGAALKYRVVASDSIGAPTLFASTREQREGPGDADAREEPREEEQRAAGRGGHDLHELVRVAKRDRWRPDQEKILGLRLLHSGDDLVPLDPAHLDRDPAHVTRRVRLALSSAVRVPHVRAVGRRLREEPLPGVGR
jgi:hypothetical protein